MPYNPKRIVIVDGGTVIGRVACQYGRVPVVLAHAWYKLLIRARDRRSKNYTIEAQADPSL
jgi:hypothetical protein